AGRAGAVTPDRTARARAGDVEMVEGGTARRVPRLQPEREGSHHLLGLFGPAAARRARLRASRLGRGGGLQSPPPHHPAPADSPAGTLPAGSAARGAPPAGTDAAAGSLEALLDLAARDDAEGLADAPWPPHYRKMEGEAPRVAPSRARPAAGAAKRPPRVK